MSHGEVEQADLGFAEFVNHVADDLISVLGDHEDTIALPETVDEIRIHPTVLETGFLDGQHGIHISAYHPAKRWLDLLACLLHGRLLSGSGFGGLVSSSSSSKLKPTTRPQVQQTHSVRADLRIGRQGWVVRQWGQYSRGWVIPTDSVV